LRGNPGKSGVEQFEWSLITLVSVAWRLLLSQELFYQYSNALWKFVRTKKSQKKEPTLCQSQNRKGWATPEHFTHSVFDDSDRVRHLPLDLMLIPDTVAEANPRMG